MRLRTLLLGMALGLAAPALPALAHHGWAWTENGLFELTGIIKAVYVGNPHASLDVDVEGETWRVELAPPGPTMPAGFTETSAKPGDEVVALGNRSIDPNEKRMKAVRITVDGKVFDVYPARVPAN
ncbi:DUF6152 family protein [Devosia sp. CN2-171]|uniref:DUF6152 family protein n=1 Tax=Devosia sp. CN2-171 TaxID=3400909 RepID=UPI003BF8B815